MLTDSKAFSGFSVNDLAAARAFYGDTLGLEVILERGLMFLTLPVAIPSSSIPSRTTCRPHSPS
jgi:catechol 2,3-dioxygenase-like lactoylglutathione lyase family enzyme